jgi:alanyl aminopeptidase
MVTGIGKPMRQSQFAIAISTVFFILAGCGPADEPDDTASVSPGATPNVSSLAAVAPKGQLPAGVRPLSYQVDMLLDPRRDDFTGEVVIDVNLDKRTNRIWLHGKGLVVSHATATTEAGEVISGSYEEVLETGVSAISFESELPSGVVSLNLRYQGEFDRNLAGLFKVEEQGESYALAKSESIQARSYLPGFDEPGLKATFDISLTIPEGQEAIGNSPVIDRHPVGEGLERLVFATTPPMSTYLLSLAVGPFEIVERAPIPPNEFRSRPIPLRGVTRSGRAGDMNYVLDVTPRMVEIFEQELRRPYPFEKLDIVAAPQWPSGATELSAAITYREQLILVGDNPAPGARLSLLGVHAHEIAHMWLGNQVTPPWWDDLWLKEGFATWATPLVLTILEPEGGHGLNALERSIGAMQLDSLASTRAIREPISENAEIRNAYDSITYSKSLGVIHMIDRYFGSDVFRPALGRYVETFSDGVADSADFYRVISEETKSPALAETFRGFVEQTGVPLLEVELNCEVRDAPSLNISQSRYKAFGSPIQDADKVWNIPVCIRSNEARQCMMVTEARQTLQLSGAECPQWVLPNAEGSGYYRWTLDEVSWAALIDNFELLSPVEALSAIDSAFAAFEAGKLNQAHLLSIVSASSRAQARQVITAPIPYLQKYVQQYFSSEEKAEFLAFARDLYQPIIESSANSADEDGQLLYTDLISFLALTAQDPGARNELLRMAHAFTGFDRDRDDDALQSDLYYAALTVAVQDSGARFLPHLVEFRGALDDPLFESESAYAIGRISNPDLLGTIHELALGEQLGPREVFSLVGMGLREPEVRDQHWTWIQENFPAIVDKIPTQWRRYTPGMARLFCEQDKLTELKQLYGEYADLVPGYQRSLDQTEEQILLCIALQDQGKKLASAMDTF